MAKSKKKAAKSKEKPKQKLKAPAKAAPKKAAPKPPAKKAVKTLSSTKKTANKAVVSTNKISAKAPLKEKTTTSKKNVAPIQLTANDNDVVANSTARYNAKDLEMFRKVIHEQRAEASEEFDIISQQLMDTSGEFDGENQSFALHTAEQGSDAMEREKHFLQAQRTSDYIKKLDEALERIGRGTYGICVICGNLIEKQRLYAVPIT